MMAIDLWGPVDKAASGGYKYVLGSIDYLSGYHLAELLRTKDEVASAWRRMLSSDQNPWLQCHGGSCGQ